MTKYDHRDVNGTKDGELMCLLEKTAFPLEKGPISTTC